MMTVPLVMLVALWLFAVSVTLPSALDLGSAGTVSDRISEPGEAMVTALQLERQATVAFGASGRKAGQQAMAAQRAKTDAAVSAFRSSSSSSAARGAASAETLRAVQQSSKALEGLVALRGTADAGGELDDIRKGFSAIILSVSAVFESTTNHENADVAEEARAVYVLSIARELLSQEDALVGSFVADKDFTADDHAQVIGLTGQIRLILPYGATLMQTPQQVQYQQLVAAPAWKSLQALEDKLAVTTPGTPAGSGLELAVWRAAFDPVEASLIGFEADVQQVNVQHAAEASTAIVLLLVIAGVLGVLAVVLALVLSVRIGRSLVRRLDGLRGAALDLADVRLPSVVSRLRRGVAVDLAAEAPALVLGSDEIGQVAEAFNTVQRTAVASAVEEASVRQGMNEVFLNIARRSQTLLHRQLSLLDSMERRTGEPEDLADLFRVDHLATRMRRHAEDLVILAGAAPGRGWRNPVPVIDVVRGAVSEVEDYARVQVQQVGAGAVVGRAVGDMIHLLAELIENATAFSPPHTQVQVSGQSVPNGFVVEIEDRGLGMTAEAIEEANRRLSQPPEFDPANSSRLGLFVVAQLATRHGVRVVLRASPYGGVTAVALLPMGLVVAEASALPVGAPQELSNTHELPMVMPDEFSWLAEGLAPAPEGLAPVVAADRPDRGPQRPALSVVQNRQQEPLRAVQRPVAGVAPIRAVPSPVVPVKAASSPVAPKSGRGLPKRVRQQSLAPQLQSDETVVMHPEDVPEAEATRSPEQLRRMMSSFQAGTVRGRHASAGDGGEPAGGSVAPDAQGVGAGGTGDGVTS